MNKYLSRFGGIAILLFLSGCEFFASSGEKAVREVLDATKDLSDTMHSVRDANSAMAVVDVLDAKYARMIASMKNFMQHKHDKMLKSTMDDLARQLQEVQLQLKSEGERLTQLRGLPLPFWKIAKLRSVELMVASLEMLDAAPGNASGDAIKSIKELQGLWTTNGYEKVVQIEMENLPFDLSQKACDKIQQAAAGAKVLHFPAGDKKSSVVLGPVHDYKAFLASLDLGAVTFEDEGQRTIHVTVDRRKLGALGNSDAEEAELRQKKMHEEFQKRVEESRSQSARQFAESVSEQKQRVKEARVPDRNDPQYFEKLADRMIDSHNFHQDEAIDALLDATPAEVPSAETRKQIARNFKKLAEGNDHFKKGKAAKGLAIWGGKFSTPILLKMLDDNSRMNQKEIIAALGDLQDPQAAEALAARLGDFFTHETAYNAIKQMGAAAEDALIAVGPSDNPKICLAAINLLGDAGSEKSFPFLREAQTSRNVEVRNAAKAAMRKIVARKNKSTTKKP